MEKAPVKLAKLWCKQCGNYTRHRREDPVAVCLTCGQKQTLVGQLPPLQTTDALSNLQRPGSMLLWRKPRSPEREKVYNFALSEAKLILESMQQLNTFLRQNAVEAHPLACHDLQRLIADLNKLLQDAGN